MRLYNILKEKYESIVDYLFGNSISKENEKLRIENAIIDRKNKDLERILENQNILFKELNNSNVYSSSLENLK